MTPIAAALLLLGTILAALGASAYVWGAFHDPDPASQHIARATATAGRRASWIGLPLWFGTGHTASQLLTALVALAFGSAIASFVTRLGAPGTGWGVAQ